MSDAIRNFHRELYLEHIEEISFLYENRMVDLCSDQLQWHELQGDEERIDAHLDALVTGGQIALDIILELCHEGDLNAFYIAACLYCRHNDIRALFKFFSTVKLEQPELLNAIKDGLIQEWPQQWFASLVRYPFHDFPRLLPIFLPLYANRREPLDQQLYQIALHGGLLEQSQCLRSVRHLHGGPVIPHETWQLSEEESPEALQEKALCLLELADPYQILDYFQKQLPEQNIPFAAISIATDERLARYIAHPQETPTAARVIAMGLTGLRDFVPPLLHYLRDEDITATAAQALQTITGAGLMSPLFIEEEWDEDELFADELKAFRDGQPPQHPDGGPYGTREEVLSTDPVVWEHWLQQNAKHFKPGIRYRLGYPISPQTLVYTLSHPLSSRLVRYLSYEELALRYGATLPFNPEDWVSKQKLAISELNHWAKSVAQNFEPGDWYLHGQIMQVDVVQASAQEVH